MTLFVKCDCGGRLTRLIRLAPGFFSMNSARVLFGTHSEIICRGSVVTPMKETMLGCLNLFHKMASSKNDYRTHERSRVDAIKICGIEYEPS